MNSRTVVMAKEEMVALLGLRTSDEGGLICRVDPREKQPAVQIYDDATLARHWFAKSIASSRRNGWQIVYDGLPLSG